MKLCEVVGRVWPEQTLDGLNGRALVAVRDVHDSRVLVALDLIDAGVGAKVLVVTGEPARAIAGLAPVDAVVTAIVNADAIAPRETAPSPATRPASARGVVGPELA